ncbi:hypothetical protein SLS64_009809 [Diaporthe eres]
MVWTQAKAVAVLAAVDASAQGFFSSLSQQATACGPYNFFDMGCYVASTTPVSGTSVFEISNYVPGTANVGYYQKSHPQFWGDVPGITNFNATTTPFTCAAACQGYGYKIGQLLTNRCTCTVMLALTARTNYNSGAAPSCTSARCFGDFDQFCGGASTGEGVKVSADPSFPSDADIRANTATLALGYKYLGCFNLGSTGFRNNKGATTSATKENCYTRCAQEGYPYASFAGGECDCGVSFGPGSYQFNRAADTCETGQGGRPVVVNPDLQGCYIPPVPGYGNLDAQNNLASYTCAADVVFSKNLAVQPLSITSPGTNKVNTVLPVRQRQVGSFYIRGCYSSDMSVAFGIPSPAQKPGANSLDMCANICASFQYFGLQNGGLWCACSDTLAIEPDAVDMSVCNRKCASTPRQNCGAGSGPIVYGKATVGNAHLRCPYQLRGELCSQFHGELCGQLCGQLRGQLRSELCGEFCSELCGEFYSQLCGQLYGEFCGQLCYQQYWRPSISLEPPSTTSSVTTSTSEPMETVTLAYPQYTDYAAAADVPVGEGIRAYIFPNSQQEDVVVENNGCYVLQDGATPFLGPQAATPSFGDPQRCAEFCYARQFDFNGAIDQRCYCGNELAPTSPDRYTQIPCPTPNSSNGGRSNQDGQDIVGRSIVHRALGYLQVFKVLNRARVRVVVEAPSSSSTSSVAESTSSLSLGSSTSGAVVGTTSSALGTGSTPVLGGSSTSGASFPTLSTSSGMFANSSTASGGLGASSTASGLFGNSSTASGGAETSSGSGGQSGSLSTPSSGFGLSSTATGFFGNSSTGSGGVRPTTSRGTSRSSSVSGGGGSATSGSNSGGTIITSSSTQYFTVTTGVSGSSQTGPVTGSGSMSSIPTGSMGSSGAPSASGSGTSPSGSAVPSSAVFVIQIGPANPSESGAPGSKARRQSGEGGFVGNAGVNNPVECSQATQFAIIDGELTSGGQKVSTNPGVSSAPLAVRPAVGLITRTWEIVDDELLWVNAAFVGGEATFCVDTATSRVIFSTTGAGNEPVGCTPIELTPLFGKSSPLRMNYLGLP